MMFVTAIAIFVTIHTSILARVLMVSDAVRRRKTPSLGRRRLCIRLRRTRDSEASGRSHARYHVHKVCSARRRLSSACRARANRRHRVDVFHVIVVDVGIVGDAIVAIGAHIGGRTLRLAHFDCGRSCGPTVFLLTSNTERGGNG